MTRPAADGRLPPDAVPRGSGAVAAPGRSRDVTGPAPETDSALGTGRVTALTDGVFAIAMTLLVLDVKDAAVAADPARPLLAAVGPQLFGYGLGFVILGLLWNGHHVVFAYVERADRVLLWLNVAFLLSAALGPDPTLYALFPSAAAEAALCP